MCLFLKFKIQNSNTTIPRQLIHTNNVDRMQKPTWLTIDRLMCTKKHILFCFSICVRCEEHIRAQATRSSGLDIGCKVVGE